MQELFFNNFSCRHWKVRWLVCAAEKIQFCAQKFQFRVEKFQFSAERIRFSAKKFQFSAKKFQFSAQKIQISAEKIQKITNRVDWILSKRVCDVITIRAIAHEVTWSYGDLPFSSWCHRKKSI